MSAIVALTENQEENNIISYFRSKKAITPKSAIKINKEEFEKSGPLLVKPSQIDPSKLPFITVINSNLYYLDEDKLKKVVQQRRNLGLYVLGILIIVIGFSIVMIF